MIILIFSAFLVVTSVTNYLLYRKTVKKSPVKIDFKKLLAGTTMALILGLVIGSLSLQTFEASEEVKINLQTWLSLKPILLVLTIIIVLESIAIRRRIKC